ncbi:hypothetical protein D3C71_1350650 [compost metagenome]
MTSSAPTRKSVSWKMWLTVQKKSTPFKKPRNSGGSPSGVSEPPALDTMKMKNTTTCATCLRLSLARIRGRISSMDAPVVPMKLASTAPMARMVVLSPGLPCRLPRMKIPPATVNSAVSRITNGMYSATSACTRLTPAMPGPNVMANGTRNASPQAAATLPKWWCQKIGARSGMRAIDSRMPANGTPQRTDSVLPSMSAARAQPGSAAKRPATASPRESFMGCVSIQL